MHFVSKVTKRPGQTCEQHAYEQQKAQKKTTEQKTLMLRLITA